MIMKIFLLSQEEITFLREIGHAELSSIQRIKFHCFWMSHAICNTILCPAENKVGTINGG